MIRTLCWKLRMLCYVPKWPLFGWNNMLAFPLALPCASYHTDESTVLVSFIMTMRKCKDKTNGYNKCFMSETLSPWHPEIPLQGCCHFCYTRLIAPGYCIQIEGIALTHMIWACIKVQCNFLNNHTLMDRTHVCPYGSTVIVLLDQDCWKIKWQVQQLWWWCMFAL